MIQGDLCRSSAFYSLATRRSPVKQMIVPVQEKPEELIGSQGSLFQLLLAAYTRPLELLQSIGTVVLGSLHTPDPTLMSVETQIGLPLML